MARTSTSPLVQQVLAQFAGAMRERFGPRLLDLRLFGSYARGEAHQDSDVDVLVVLDSASWADRKETLNLAGDLWRESELLISPTILDREVFETWRRQQRPLLKNIEAEGIPL